jgi:hypothetical protein
MQDFLFINLEAQKSGAKPFDGMSIGTFIDMRGIKASFKKEELPEYVKNTKASIASTADDSGNVVGLPIDPRGHYHDEDAAGWVIDVALSEDGSKVIFFPRWTEQGVYLIGNDLQRFFSPTIDLANKVIMGGSLTNWPATRSPKGEILLKPVELSMSEETLSFTDGSLDEQVNKCKQAFYDLYWQLDAWPLEVFTDNLIAYLGEELYRVPFTVADGAYTFAAQNEWVKVKLSYVEAAMKWVKRLFKKADATAQAQPEQITEGASTMPEPEKQVSPTAVELTAEQEARLENIVNARVEAKLARMERENKVLSLSRDLAGKGLPIEATELASFLTSLTQEQQAAAEKIFSRVAEVGLVPMTELGHSRVMAGTKPLPEDVKPILADHLAAGGDLTEFFRVNSVELGAQADYDLAEFKKEA